MARPVGALINGAAPVSRGTSDPMSALKPASPQGPIVIIGAGQAGCELAFALAQQGQAGRILLIGDERGQLAERSFSVFYLLEGRILSVDAINRPQEFMVSKRLIAERVRADPATLADEAVPLQSLLENRVTSIG
jgi:hypothetical protein